MFGATFWDLEQVSFFGGGRHLYHMFGATFWDLEQFSLFLQTFVSHVWGHFLGFRAVFVFFFAELICHFEGFC